jgi:hypothetical protein
MANLEETLQERGSRYGSFVHHAAITQELKATIRRYLAPLSHWSQISRRRWI